MDHSLGQCGKSVLTVFISFDREYAGIIPTSLAQDLCHPVMLSRNTFANLICILAKSRGTRVATCRHACAQSFFALLHDDFSPTTHQICYSFRGCNAAPRRNVKWPVLLLQWFSSPALSTMSMRAITTKRTFATSCMERLKADLSARRSMNSQWACRFWITFESHALKMVHSVFSFLIIVAFSLGKSPKADWLSSGIISA